MANLKSRYRGHDRIQLDAEQARSHILAAIKVSGRREVLDAIVQWNNTAENDISDDGNVWVANPQAGHWLDDDRLVEFANFLD